MAALTTDHLLARQRAAGAFLRSRRGRLAPFEVGLPEGRRRRTPGLRREEVAMLAGVGTTWYTWLEQGREIQPSAEVLASLADVLQLDAAERRHLFALYDRSPPEGGSSGEDHVSEALRQMIGALDGQAAFVLGRHWDVLTWNKAADLIVGSYPGLNGGRPNVFDLVFSDRVRRLFVDWEIMVRGAIATFRSDCTASIGDPDFEALIRRLSTLSSEFAKWWSQYDVAHRMAGVKRLDHPSVGRMHFAFSMLAVGERPGMKLLVLTPTEEEDTPKKLRRLLSKTHLCA